MHKSQLLSWERDWGRFHETCFANSFLFCFKSKLYNLFRVGRHWMHESWLRVVGLCSEILMRLPFYIHPSSMLCCKSLTSANFNLFKDNWYLNLLQSFGFESKTIITRPGLNPTNIKYFIVNRGNIGGVGTGIFSKQLGSFRTNKYPLLLLEQRNRV